MRRSLEILSVKKEANLSGRDMDEEEVGNGDVEVQSSVGYGVRERLATRDVLDFNIGHSLYMT